MSQILFKTTFLFSFIPTLSGELRKKRPEVGRGSLFLHKVRGLGRTKNVNIENVTQQNLGVQAVSFVEHTASIVFLLHCTVFAKKKSLQSFFFRISDKVS